MREPGDSLGRQPAALLSRLPGAVLADSGRLYDGGGSGRGPSERSCLLSPARVWSGTGSRQRLSTHNRGVLGSASFAREPGLRTLPPAHPGLEMGEGGVFGARVPALGTEGAGETDGRTRAAQGALLAGPLPSLVLCLCI